MRFSFFLLASLAMAKTPEISVFQSRTMPGMSIYLVDDCPVEVSNYDIDINPNKVVKKINDLCHMNLKLDDLNVGQKE